MSWSLFTGTSGEHTEASFISAHSLIIPSGTSGHFNYDVTDQLSCQITLLLHSPDLITSPSIKARKSDLSKLG